MAPANDGGNARPYLSAHVEANVHNYKQARWCTASNTAPSTHHTTTSLPIHPPPCPLACRELTNILLMDFKGSGFTRPHADRSEAWNIALALGEVVGQVVARWLFFHPTVAKRASALWKKVGGAAEGFNTDLHSHDKVRSRCGGRWAAAGRSRRRVLGGGGAQPPACAGRRLGERGGGVCWAAVGCWAAAGCWGRCLPACLHRHRHHQHHSPALLRSLCGTLSRRCASASSRAQTSTPAPSSLRSGRSPASWCGCRLDGCTW